MHTVLIFLSECPAVKHTHSPCGEGLGNTEDRSIKKETSNAFKNLKFPLGHTHIPQGFHILSL